MFKKYQHVERFGNGEVNGIERGVCYVFPKIDGTNGSVWLEDGYLCFGSRNLSLDDHDNQGFKDAIVSDKTDKVFLYLREHPNHRLYGEWLVPHTLKTYREDAWRKFYVFDVCIDTEDGVTYLPYDIYAPLLEKHNIEYIPLLAQVHNGVYEQFVRLLDSNTFLIRDGLGVGEGVVIKNYSFVNRFGRTTWAKIVRSEFKEANHKAFGAPIVKGETMVEEKIAAQFCTTALIEKEHAKIVNDDGGWNSKQIPRLFNTVFYSLVTEDMWEIVKEFKQPKVDFKTLKYMCIERVKAAKPELFN